MHGTGHMQQPAPIDVSPLTSQAERWAAPMKTQFERLAPLAVYLASAPEIVSGQSHDTTGDVLSSWGGRKGSRLVVIGETSSPPWLSAVNISLGRSVHRLRLQWRVWVPRRDRPGHDAIQQQLITVLQSMCAELRNYPDRDGGVMLLRPSADLADLHQRTLQQAATLTNQLWTDGGLRRECRERAEAQYATRGGR